MEYQTMRLAYSTTNKEVAVPKGPGAIGKPLARSAEREFLPYGFPELSVKSPFSAIQRSTPGSAEKVSPKNIKSAASLHGKRLFSSAISLPHTGFPGGVQAARPSRPSCVTGRIHLPL